MNNQFIAIVGVLTGICCGMLVFLIDRKKRRILSEAQVQRFERLEFFLHCCTHYEHLDQFDKMCDKDLTASDCRLQRYFWLMVERGKKERVINGNEIMLQNSRICEGDKLLQSIKLQ